MNLEESLIIVSANKDYFSKKKHEVMKLYQLDERV